MTNINRALLALSAILAIAYGAFGSSLYEGAPPFVVGTIFKASSIITLGLIALLARSRLLAAGLLFGALGDALLAWSPDTFLYGALAFLIGHLFYITIWLRSGIGVVAALKEPPRLIGALALIAAAFVMTYLLVPRDNAMFVPLSVYTGVLTLMALCSFTLPASRWLVMAGAALFFISDGFVGWNMFHPDPNPTLAYWRSFAGWLVYWGGQAAICVGALGLHRTSRYCSLFVLDRGAVLKINAASGSWHDRLRYYRFERHCALVRLLRRGVRAPGLCAQLRRRHLGGVRPQRQRR
ncbi:lysoplasmalogenase [Terricaulis sp.]|uniref:lysoplasmalogenase n=1 Tax=Terricaulis sp. TaxID=2768686 RepID=UPI002AC72341|nr:lysoplasmalogenase [Terricaulis sp.]MDZ4693463.1 lysoplasmalogenase [Terricaulis sp.]